MPKRPTLHDLAKAAGVGVATVDRVLNNRPNVSPAMVERVADAAERIGYRTRALISVREGATRPKVTFGFVLQKQAQCFYQNFAGALQAAVTARSDIDGRCHIRFTNSSSPDDFAAAFDALAPLSDAIAAVATNHQRLTQKVRALREDGTAVFALLNDFAQGERDGYLGLNNINVGRLAAWMLTTRLHNPGKLAVFVGSSRWHSHVLRETGFQSYLRERKPGFEMLPTMVNLDTRQLTYEATLDLLNRQPDLRGLYIAGGGMEGAIAAVREMRPPGKVALVVNELTETSRTALADRYVCMVISTPLAEMCRDLVKQMIKAARQGPAAVSGQQFFEPRLYLPESV